MKILLILLSLIFSLPGSGWEMAATAQSTELMPQEALDALYALLEDTRLTLSGEGYDLTLAGEPLLWARAGGVIASGSASAPFEAELREANMLELAEALGRRLADLEKEKSDSFDLQEAGTARKALIYTLSAEEWAQRWPELAELLGLSRLSGADVPGKATFKRYFDRNGREIGAYFYTEKMILAGVAREVRLEYGYQPERGFCLAFRCPQAGGGENTRISLHARRLEAGWSASGEIQETGNGCSRTVTVSRRTNGKLTLEWTEKNGGRTAVHSCVLQCGEDGAEYTLSTRDGMLLSGSLSWRRAELPERKAEGAPGALHDVSAALSGKLLSALRQYAPEGWQQLLHQLARGAWIDAQKEDSNR